MTEEKEFKQRYEYGLDHRPKSRMGVFIFFSILIVLILIAIGVYFLFFSNDIETLLPNEVDFESSTVVANVDKSFILEDKVNLFFKYNGLNIVQFLGRDSQLILTNLNSSCYVEKLINLRTEDQGTGIILFRNNENGQIVFICSEVFEDDRVVKGNVTLSFKNSGSNAERPVYGSFRIKSD